jgi:hypothetical protein
MSAPRLKSLRDCADAAGGAFGFDEADFEARYVPPVRPSRIAAFALVFGGGAAAIAHHMGWTNIVASLGNWRAAV